MSKLVALIDKVAIPLVWVSITLYIVESLLGTPDSRHGWLGFLWIERFIASFFLFEYFVRFIEDKLNPDATEDINFVPGLKGYASSPLGIIDLLSWVPFVVGFFVPTQYLGIIRSLRVFRLLKYFRYSRHMQLVALGFYRSWVHLKTIMFVLFIVGLFNSIIMYEIEHKYQPDKFATLWDSSWYVLVSATTVGYGDMSPISSLGKFVAAFTLLIPTLAIYAGMIGILGGMFTTVLEEEKDPDIDPIQKFKEEYRARKNG